MIPWGRGDVWAGAGTARMDTERKGRIQREEAFKMEERVMVDRLGMNVLDGTITDMLYSLSVDVTESDSSLEGQETDL
jgi:hypothetical protein